MDNDQLNSIFDQQAATYDQQWVKLAAFREGLLILSTSIFRGLPSTARLLCVGAGTGAEIQHLAERFPGWSFTAVEPSAGMLDVCRQRAQAHGFADRCSFHQGYLDSLPLTEPFDAATCLLVSQFILDTHERAGFFSTIAQRLVPGGTLVSSDLSTDVSSDDYPSLLGVWLRTMAAADVTPEGIQRMREAYRRDVAVLPAAQVEAILVSGGFESPIQFYQAGLIRAWYSKRSSPTRDA